MDEFRRLGLIIILGFVLAEAELFLSSLDIEPPENRQGDIIVCNNSRLKPKNFQRFLKSFRQVNPIAEVVVFLPFLDEATEHIMTTFRAKYILYNEEELPPELIPTEKFIHRFSLYRRFLEKNSAVYKRVFICDARDVIFQEDPFSRLNPNITLLNFLSDVSVSYCAFNKQWMKDCFGEAIYQGIKSRRMAIAGTTIGTYWSIMDYLVKQEQLINSVKCTTSARDNVILNVLYYNNLLPGTEVIDNQDGWMGTLIYKTKFLRDRYGRVVNDRGVPYAVLHQYDRHPWLETIIDNMFPYDPAFETFFVFYPNVEPDPLLNSDSDPVPAHPDNLGVPVSSTS